MIIVEHAEDRCSLNRADDVHEVAATPADSAGRVGRARASA
jgi:hypothetical protein